MGGHLRGTDSAFAQLVMLGTLVLTSVALGLPFSPRSRVQGPRPPPAGSEARTRCIATTELPLIPGAALARMASTRAFCIASTSGSAATLKGPKIERAALRLLAARGAPLEARGAFEHTPLLCAARHCQRSDNLQPGDTMKIHCECGHWIHDSTDFISAKAHVIPDQLWFRAVNAIDAAVERAASRPDEQEAAIHAARAAIGTVATMAWQCSRCGRLYVDERGGELHTFVPADRTVDKEVLRAYEPPDLDQLTRIGSRLGGLLGGSDTDTSALRTYVAELMHGGAALWACFLEGIITQDELRDRVLSAFESWWVEHSIQAAHGDLAAHVDDGVASEILDALFPPRERFRS